MRTAVCKVDEVAPGKMIAGVIEHTPVVICRTPDGEWHALYNRCIHQGALLSKGKICGTPAPTNTPGEYRYTREGEILRCPWHGREYDIKCGGTMLSDRRRKLPSFVVTVEGNEVFVSREHEVYCIKQPEGRT